MTTRRAPPTRDDEGLRISAVSCLPRRLKADAPQADIIKAINELAIETQLCRLSIQDVGTKLGELSEHIRDALMGGAKEGKNG
jgi:hypothetical protein